MIRLGAVALVWFAASSAYALDVPTLNGHRVNDNAGLLSAPTRDALEAKLQKIEADTGHQFVFLSVQSLNGASIEEFSNKTFHAWKLGDAKRDDGLLFVVSSGDRKMRLEVGYGLEGVIPDAVAKRIVSDVVTPAFKRAEWGVGANAAFDACLLAANPPAHAEPPVADKKPAEKAEGGYWLAWLIVFSGGFVGLLVWFAKRQQEREEQARVAREASYRTVRGASMYSTPGPLYTPAAPVYSSPAPSKPATRYSSDDSSSSSSSTATTSYDYSSSDSSSSSSSDSSSDFGGGGGDSGGGGASGDF